MTASFRQPGLPNASAAPLLDPQFMRRLDRLDLLSRKVLAGKLKGERRSKRKGQSVEFADYRQYVVGDDLRFIDWNLFARLDRLFLRLFLEEEDLSVSILIDTTASMDFGDPNKLRYARQVAAALGYIGLVHYNRVHMFTFSNGIDSRLSDLRGRRPVPQMLHFLNSITPVNKPGDLNAACRRFAMIQRRKGVVILISDFLDKGDLGSALRYLRGDLYDAYALQLLSPQEIDPAKAQVLGDLKLRDVEDGEEAEVTVTPALLKRYQSALRGYCDYVRAECLRRDIAYMAGDTAVPFDTLVLRYLRERGVLG